MWRNMHAWSLDTDFRVFFCGNRLFLKRLMLSKAGEVLSAFTFCAGSASVLVARKNE